MTYDAEGGRVKKLYRPSVGVAVTTTYVGNMYEKRTYSDGSPERHTLHVFGNGQLIASVTQTGNIATAYNEANRWRAEWALGAMYDPTSLAGAGKKLVHIARAVAAHPATARRVGGALFAAAAMSLIATLLLSLFRRGFARATSPALRFASLGVLLVFGFAACTSGPGDRRSVAEPILSGDTLLGPPAGTFFYHRNHVNSSSVITDHAGNERSRYAYLPFGEIARQNSCGTDTVTAKFTGKEYDEETSLYYFGARYYDPAIGRFLSPDTVLPSLTDGQTLNRYSYVRNNPIMYIDPTGHFLDFIGGVVTAVENSVQYVASAIEHAADWVANAARETGDFIAEAAGYTWMMMKAFGSDPRALAVFVIAVGICVATGNAPVLVIVMQAAGSMLGAMAAQSIAIAAGVTNPTVMSIIGIAGGVLGGGGGLAQLLKAGAAFGVAYGLGKAEAALFSDKIAAQLAPLNALAGVLVVNGLAKAFGSSPAQDAPKDPNTRPATPEQLAGSGGGVGRPSFTEHILVEGQRPNVQGALNIMAGASMVLVGIGAIGLLIAGGSLFFAGLLVYGSLLGIVWGIATIAAEVRSPNAPVLEPPPEACMP
jgi:RHS repeat-associated protein